MNFVWKTNEGEVESTILLILFFGGALIVHWWEVVERGRKSYLGPVEIPSFSSRDFSRSNRYDTFWYVISTRYFYVLFLWTIAVSDFLPLPTIAFTVNSHADHHFYKYIYLFQILYSIKSK